MTRRREGRQDSVIGRTPSFLRNWLWPSFVALLVLGAGAVPRSWAQSPFDVPDGGWVGVAEERYGAKLAYPKDLFAPRYSRPDQEGLVLVSRDGRARLGSVTFENEDGWSLLHYRRHLLETNYAGAVLDYAPIRRTWFVVSGRRNGMHFYERVSFTCQGRLINSWALVYPDSERDVYDRIVEAVALSYTPGGGGGRGCG